MGLARPPLSDVLPGRRAAKGLGVGAHPHPHSKSPGLRVWFATGSGVKSGRRPVPRTLRDVLPGRRVAKGVGVGAHPLSDGLTSYMMVIPSYMLVLPSYMKVLPSHI